MPGGAQYAITPDHMTKKSSLTVRSGVAGEYGPSVRQFL